MITKPNHHGARALAAAAVATCALTAPGATLAQTGAEPFQLEEVVVTAQRRSENLQDVPIAVSTLDAAQLAQGGITNVVELGTAVPGLNVINANGMLNVSLRGVGSNAVAPGFENPVAIYVDGIYQASSVANYLNLANIAQVAVLKGPQGTLFGRNATGGLIQVTTRDPSQETEAEASLSYGNYDTMTGTFYLGGGVTDALAGDISVYAARQDGHWGDNLLAGGPEVYTMDHDITARSKWILSLGEDTKFTLIGDYSDVSHRLNVPTVKPGTISGFTPELGVAPDTGYDVAVDAQNYKEGHAWGVSLQGQHDFAGVSLIGTVAWRESEFESGFELDGGPLPVANAVYTWPDEQLSAELQLQSNTDSAFSWQAGVYYFDADASYAPITLTAFPVIVSIHNSQSTESIAGYAQGSYRFSNATTLTVGGRYTSEDRKAHDGTTDVFVIPFNLQLPTEVAPDETASFDKFNYRVSLDHRFSEDWLAYVSTSTGFKSGGFNTGSPGTPAYRPETVTAYEIGTKADLLDRRMRWNNAVYYYDYKDMQTQVLLTGTTVISIANAAEARIYGLDSDFQFQATDALRLNGGISWLHATYESYPDALLSDPVGGVPSTVGPADGNFLPYAPEFTATLGGDYTWNLPAGSLRLAGRAYYTDEIHFEADNVVSQPSYVNLAADLRWTSGSGRFWVSVYGKNLLDERTIGYATTQSNGTHLLEWAAPLTYGVALGASL